MSNRTPKRDPQLEAHLAGLHPEVRAMLERRMANTGESLLEATQAILAYIDGPDAKGGRP